MYREKSVDTKICINREMWHKERNKDRDQELI